MGICWNCNKVIKGKPEYVDHHSNLLFCSKKCLLESCSQKLVCSYCERPLHGDVIYDTRGIYSEIDKDRLHGHYCSEECFCRAWKEYSDNDDWKESLKK